MQETTGVVLAGGKSTRMGANKAFLSLEGHSLIERVVAELRKAFPEVLVVGDPETYRGLADRVVADIFPEAGPLGGIHAGLTFASYDPVFVAACDLPFVEGSLASLIVERLDGFDAAVPCVGGRLQPLFAAYRKTCLGPVTRSLEAGRRRVVGFLGEVRVCYLTEADFEGWPHFRRVFFNVNTPADIRRLQHRIAAGVPVVGVAGPSKTGKTRLIEGIVAELAAAGYRVAVLKHTVHELADTPGKDTERFARAGAVKTALAGPGGLFYFQAAGEPELGPVLEFLEDAVDLILVEGYKEAPLPQIKVLGNGEEPVLDERTVALVTGDPGKYCGIPVFSFSAAPAVAALIVDRFLKREDKGY
ncbi:MAG: bifunctional molybdenum cofactor guanylyltransferase MobA/molybdopterin-guanine dinucleotide biosynthesis adaptor protein MobB [Bacillota bacterium]|jgi:molybdopterin-guanine dinucleotide biosynthesis protein MobB|nr:bifunctional molybdenum cofactor guanylyltransferase MobA/molybdopterin-guanine dinucleotide biosynthesis adaptor protein MobB [Thermoanaerobacteraceae bacterium]